MKNIIIFGYAFWGGKLYKELLDSDTYHILGFADNDREKQKGYVNGIKVKSIEDLLELRKEKEYIILWEKGSGDGTDCRDVPTGNARYDIADSRTLGGNFSTMFGEWHTERNDKVL